MTVFNHFFDIFSFTIIVNRFNFFFDLFILLDWTNLLLKKYWMPIIIEGKNDKLEEKQPTPTPTPVTTNPENPNALNGANTETTIQPTAIVEQELEHIPHQPSQFITTILYEICLEIQRAHGQIIGHVFNSLFNIFFLIFYFKIVSLISTLIVAF